MIPGSGRPAGEGKGYPLTPVFRPGEFHGLYSPQGHKMLDTTERLPLSWRRLTFHMKEDDDSKWTGGCKDVEK